MTGTPIILMEGVQKWFGSFQVLTDIDLAVAPGERIVVCGPSGSGKSDLALRLLDRGFMLVSDDRTIVRKEGTRLVTSFSGAF